MKWRVATSLSSVGTAYRDCAANYREPWSVHAWLSTKGKPVIHVYTGRRQTSLGKSTMTSTKEASRFEDWEPYEPFPVMQTIAIASSLEEGELRLVQRKVGKRPRNRRHKPNRKTFLELIEKIKKERAE